MALSLVKEPVESIPIKMSSDNVILIGNTRVPLDTAVDAFVSGATPEEIVYQYSSLDLADVYAVVGTTYTIGLKSMSIYSNVKSKPIQYDSRMSKRSHPLAYANACLTDANVSHEEQIMNKQNYI